MNDDISDTEEGATGVAIYDQHTAVLLARAEVDQQITTAHAFPRSLARVQKAMLDIIQLDEEAARECMYAVPIDRKPVTGPSIRFAEALKQSFGNCSAGSRVTEVNRTEQYVEAEGVFIDLETNVRTVYRSRRSIRGKGGQTYSDRMIVTTGNAACSIAMREAILKGIPKPLWRRAYEAVLLAIRGDVKTLAERRSKAIAAFAVYGVTADQIFARLEVQGVEDIGLDDLPELVAMYQSIKSGESSVEDYFGKDGPRHEVVHDALGSSKPKQVDAPTKDDLKAREESRLRDEQKAREDARLEGERKARDAAIAEADAAEKQAEEAAAAARARKAALAKAAEPPAKASDNYVEPTDQPEREREPGEDDDDNVEDVRRDDDGNAWPPPADERRADAPTTPAKEKPPERSETQGTADFGDLDAWRAEGARRYGKGMPRRALPDQLRTTAAGADKALLAFYEGWDGAKAGKG